MDEIEDKPLRRRGRKGNSFKKTILRNDQLNEKVSSPNSYGNKWTKR